MSPVGQRRRAAGLIAAAGALALVLTSCADTEDIDGGGDGDGGGNISVGTTDTVFNLDPAGAYDHGSTAIHTQVYAYLMNTPYGSPDVEPDLAESAEFTSPTEYTVTLPEGLDTVLGTDARTR